MRVLYYLCRKITIIFAQKMDLQTALYRIGSYLKHYLTARHTGGHGIHSPYLFDWVRLVMHDKHSYYTWEKIENRRQIMLTDERTVEYVDYGSGGTPSTSPLEKSAKSGDKTQAIGISRVKSGDRRKVREIAKGSLAKQKYAQMLARMVNWLGRPLLTSPSREGIDQEVSEDRKGLTIVELGTSLGITTAYLAAMDSRNNVVTYEGCPGVVAVAKENWKVLGLKNIDCHVGEIDVAVLERDIEKVDLAFVDANHTYASTREYFNVLARKVHAKSVIVVDDIHYNRDMALAWRAICADERVTSTIDLYQMGLVFFDKNYWKKHYKIRL